MEKNSDEAMNIVDTLATEEETASLLSLKGRIYTEKREWEKAEENFKQAIAKDPKKLSHYQILLQFYEKQRNAQKLENVLNQMAEIFPEKPQVYIMAARYYQATQQFDKVEPLWQKVIELSQDSALPVLQLIIYKEQRGNIPEALALAQEAHKKFPDDQKVQIRIASLLFEQQKFDESRELLDSVLAKNANLPEAQLLTARFLLQEKKYQDASNSFQQLIEEFPRWGAPYYQLSLSQFLLGNIEQAEAALGKALELNRNEAKYFAFMAKIQQARGNFKESRDNAIASLRLNPKDPRVAIVLGRALIGLKEYKEAVSIFSQIHKAIPDDKVVLKDLATASLGSGDKENGEKYLNKLLAIDPANSRGLTLYMGLKYPEDVKGATSFIRKQLEKAPQDARILFLLGNMLSSQGENKEALHYLNSALEQQPDNPQIYIAIARIYKSLGDEDKAFEQYQSLLAKQPKHIPALMGAAEILETKGEVKNATDYYEKILEIDPVNAIAANNLAWLIAERDDGDLGRALQLAMIAKQAIPDNIQVIDTLGWVHFKRQAYSLAIGQFQFALEKSPNNPTILYHLALALDAHGELEEAKKIIQQIDMTKNFPFKEKAEELKKKLSM